MSTTDRSLEQRLADLFADEAPMRGPDGLADAVLARTSPRRPRPRWLTLARETPMRLDHRPAFGSPPVRTAGILLVTLLVALLTVGSLVAGASLLPRPSLIPPELGVFTPTGSMLSGRTGATATLLADGRVLVVGGMGDICCMPLASAEVWNPLTGTFSPAGSMSVGRLGHTATLLHDGRVLVAGGLDSEVTPTSAEIWDPATSTFSPTGSLAAPHAHARGRVLPDGRVLLVGGPDPGAEVWDPRTGTWSPGDALPEASYPAGVLLPDGRILLDQTSQGSASSVFDPVTGTSTDGSPWPGYLSWSGTTFTSTPLADGRVLVVGGEDCVPQPEGSKTASIETAVGSGRVCTALTNTQAKIWDPATLSFHPTGSLPDVRSEFTAVLLTDGRVLIVGGSDRDQQLILQAEVFKLR